MVRIIGACVGLVLLALFVFPFARDAYHRYQVSRRLEAVMDDRDRAAFRAWNGDAASFGKTLYDRCELTNPPNSPVCEPYRLAIQ